VGAGAGAGVGAGVGSCSALCVAQDFALALSVFAPDAPYEQKLKLAFDMFDFDGDKAIGRSDLEVSKSVQIPCCNAAAASLSLPRRLAAQLPTRAPPRPPPPTHTHTRAAGAVARAAA
jgi:hypothetical protein